MNRLLLIALSALVSVATAQEACAQAGPFVRLVEVRLDSGSFDEFCRRLELVSGQREAADALFDIYHREIQELDDDLNRRSMKLLGADDVEGAMGRIRSLDGHAAARFTLDLHEVVKGSRAGSEAGLAALLNGVHGLLAEGQLPLWEEASRALKRDLYLSPMLDRKGPNSAVDFGVPIDLNDLIDEASAPGAELELLFGPEPEGAAAALLDARVEAARVRDELNRALDQRLAAESYDNLTEQQQLRAASQAGDAVAAKRLHGRRFDFKRALYDLNMGAAESLAGLLEAIGQLDQAARWRARVELAYFPGTMRPTMVDRMHEWLVQNLPAEEGAWEAVAAAYASYLPARDALRTEAKRLVLRMYEEVSLYVAGSNENDVFEKLDELDARLKERQDSTHAAIMAAIPAEVRERYEGELARVRQSDGPWFDTRHALRQPRGGRSGSQSSSSGSGPPR